MYKAILFSSAEPSKECYVSKNSKKLLDKVFNAFKSKFSNSGKYTDKIKESFKPNFNIQNPTL